MKKYINLFVIGALIFSSLGLFSKVKAENNSDSPGQNLEQQIRNGKDSENNDTEAETVQTRNENKEAVENSDNESEDQDENTEQEREREREQEKTRLETMKQETENEREQEKTKFEALKESIKNEKDTTKAKAAEERITGREKALERFDTAVEKMNTLKDKVNAQITKLETKGVDTSNAKNLMVVVEAKLIEINGKITEANALFAGSTNQLTIENKTKLLTLNKDIQKLIKEVHQSFNDAVKSLKQALKIKLEATKPVETETTTSTSTETN